MVRDNDMDEVCLVRPPYDGAEFGRWVVGSVTSTRHRSWYAEWLVLQAVGGDTDMVRPGDDLVTRTGVRVRVRFGALVPDWSTKRRVTVGTVEFRGLVDRRWAVRDGRCQEVSTSTADVVVFAVHTCTEDSYYDVGDPSQWVFHVVSGDTVKGWGQGRIRLSSLRSLAGREFSWGELDEAIRIAAMRAERSQR